MKLTLSSILVFFTFAALLVSGITPADRFTWFLEIIPIVILLPIIGHMNHRIPMTSVTRIFLFLGALWMMVGAKYTYSEVPLGFWLEAWFDFSRNHYDRIGHYIQGFVSALFIREALLQRTRLKRGNILFVLVLSCCLALSASYELIEWLAAVLFGDGAADFVGSQGDVWDAQWDMFLASCGAVSAQLMLSSYQDRQLQRIKK